MEAKTRLLAESISEIAARSPSERLDGDSLYVVAADLRMGDGGRSDELARSGKALFKILGNWYLPRGYTLVLNGDAEDLRNFWIKDILAAWPKLYALFDAFADDGRLRKIAGERDLALLKLKSYPYEVVHGLRLDAERGSILVAHGHQASPPYFGRAYLDDYVERWMSSAPARREAPGDSDGRGRFKAERRLFKAASDLGMPLIEGHTRRPLFESISSRDAIRVEIESLLRDGYPRRGEPTIDALVDLYRKEAARRSSRLASPSSGPGIGAAGLGSPSLFCPGRVVGARGLRLLEICGGELRLVRWSRKESEREWTGDGARIGLDRPGAPPGSIRGTPYRRMEIRSTPIGPLLERVSSFAASEEPKGG
jgi:hypothetical protein